MLKLLHSKTNQELYEKYLCNYSSHYEKYKWIEPLTPVAGAAPINYHLKSEASIVLLCQLFSTVAEQDLIEKHL